MKHFIYPVVSILQISKDVHYCSFAWHLKVFTRDFSAYCLSNQFAGQTSEGSLDIWDISTVHSHLLSLSHIIHVALELVPTHTASLHSYRCLPATHIYPQLLIHHQCIKPENISTPIFINSSKSWFVFLKLKRSFGIPPIGKIQRVRTDTGGTQE